LRLRSGIRQAVLERDRLRDNADDFDLEDNEDASDDLPRSRLDARGFSTGSRLSSRRIRGISAD